MSLTVLILRSSEKAIPPTLQCPSEWIKTKLNIYLDIDIFFFKTGLLKQVQMKVVTIKGYSKKLLIVKITLHCCHYIFHSFFKFRSLNHRLSDLYEVGLVTSSLCAYVICLPKFLKQNSVHWILFCYICSKLCFYYCS